MEWLSVVKSSSGDTVEPNTVLDMPIVIPEYVDGLRTPQK